jgi:hypothetical protein
MGMYIDQTISLPEHLPRYLLRDVEVLQEYYDSGNDAHFYPYLDAFEAGVHQCYADRQITEEEAHRLLRRYGIG